MKLSNLFGLLLLLVGVGAGVLLVQNVQDYREKAKENIKYKVCHKTGSADNPNVTIEVSSNAVEAHVNHGDTLGGCPDNGGDDNDDGGGDGGGGDDSGTGGSSDSSGGSGDSSGGSSSGGDSDSGDSSGTRVITETKYVYLNPGTLEFYIKYLGVDEKREDKSIRIEMRKEDEEVHIYEDVPVTANSEGIYSGTLREVPPATYDIFIKDINHLQAVFEDVTLQRGFNRWYWNENELIPGDMDADNDIDIEDLALFLAKFDSEEKDVTLEDTYYDVNFDKKIDRDDLELILDNYNQLVVEGQE